MRTPTFRLNKSRRLAEPLGKSWWWSGRFASPALKPPVQPGDLGRLGPYRVRAILGSGGMGTVYLALDPKLRREIALKLMHARCAVDPAMRERFAREARAQAAIEHDNVVPIFHVGESEGIPFLTMPRLYGRTLAWSLPSCPAPLLEALRITREVAEGLGAAHEVSLVHRDVKPTNIWLEWGSGRVKILDFGLAKLLTENPSDALTVCGAIVGTPSYMSPEQARGQPVGSESDLFSLGVVLYQMVTGCRPFRGSTRMETLLAVVGHTPAPPATKNPFIPRSLSNLIMQLLAKRRRLRPSSAAEVVESIRRIEQECQDRK